MTIGSLITNNGYKIIINRAYKSVPDYTVPSRIRASVASTTPLATTTGIAVPIPIQGTESVDTCDVTTGWTASGTNSVTVNATTYKEGVGALNIIKSDATSANANISKTTTSRDFTSKELWCWVYITASGLAKLATTSCIEIRFGSSNANYYYKRYDKTILSAGWNYLYFNTATATGTTGTPTIATCVYTLIQYTTTNSADTLIAGDFIVDEFKVASADDYYKSFEATYPLIDETLYQVTLRARLLTTDANGYNVDGIGWYNSDATNVLHSIDVITPESKSSTDEFIFEAVDRKIN